MYFHSLIDDTPCLEFVGLVAINLLTCGSFSFLVTNIWFCLLVASTVIAV